jgi:hypothetical protein
MHAVVNYLPVISGPVSCSLGEIIAGSGTTS